MSTPTAASAGNLSIQPTENNFSVVQVEKPAATRQWRKFLSRSTAAQKPYSASDSLSSGGDEKKIPVKWNMGVLNDKRTDEVPGKLVHWIRSLIEGNRLTGFI